VCSSDLATHLKENPSLAMMAGYTDWDRGRIAAHENKHEEAVKFYTRAIEAGEYWGYFEDRARAYGRLHRYSDELADVASGLALSPENSDLTVLRAITFLSLKRPGDAIADVRIIAEIDPTDDDLAYFRRWELENAEHQGYQLLTMTKDPNGAIRRLTTAIQLTNGGNAAVHYWRGRAYLTLEDHERALPDFTKAVELDPRHIDAIRDIDYLLAKRGEWGKIVDYWTRYIDLEPLSGQAFLERGGALHHKGDDVAAKADLRKACSLGEREACALAERVG